MDPVTIAMGIAALVPDVLKWLGHDRAAESAGKVVEIAQKVTGTGSGDAALEVLKTNPTAALQFQQELDRSKEELARIGQAPTLALLQAEAGNMADVNATMRVEDGADHWPTYSWRPFIGFSFGMYVLSLWVLPLFRVTPVTLTPDVTMAIGAILGVASFWRGKMQADTGVKSDNRG